jgi:two-component system, OmpR family, sensor kinase
VTLIRLILVNVGVLVAAGSAFAWGLILLDTYMESRSVDEALRARAESAQMDASPFAARPVYVQVIDASGSVIARSTNLAGRDLPVDANQHTLALDGVASFTTTIVEGQYLRVYVAPESNSVVESAIVVDDGQSQLPLFVIGGLCGGLVALAIGWILARIAFAPIESLATTVQTISTTDDLAQRVPADATGRHGPVARLARDVNGMLARLQSASEQLQAALESQRRFVADASHELRTPLTSIRGNAHLLVRWFSEQAGAPPRVSVEEVLSDISWESERMSRLVDGLLVLARADADHALELEPTRLTPVLDSAVRSARVLAEDVDLVVEDLAEVEDVWVAADADRLQQLVLILLDNAVRYSPAGGRVTLSAERSPRDGRHGIAIDVTDAGPGIPLEERTRIFERFYRGVATRRDTPGSGLGLAVASWITAEHGATIEVRDAEPRGSTFSVWLPTVPPSESD